MTFEEILPALRAGRKGCRKNGDHFYMQEGIVRWADGSGPAYINFNADNYELVSLLVTKHQYLYRDMNNGHWDLTWNHYANMEEVKEDYSAECIDFTPVECTAIEEEV